MKTSRDYSLLYSMHKYIIDIERFALELDMSFDKFIADDKSKYAINMCILQIGELVIKLSDEFKATYREVPWRKIIALRHRTAHAYEELDVLIVWQIAIEDIPKLKSFVEGILNEA